jgi:hypothetical protein
MCRAAVLWKETFKQRQAVHELQFWIRLLIIYFAHFLFVNAYVRASTKLQTLPVAVGASFKGNFLS